MTEALVQLAIHNSFKEYERDTGQPRHNENLGNFNSLDSRMDNVESKIDKAIGALESLKVVVYIAFGVPSVTVMVIELIRLVRGH